MQYSNQQLLDARVIIISVYMVSWGAVALGYSSLHNASFHLTISALKISIYLAITYCLIKLFNAYERKDYFNSDNIKYIFYIGISILFLQIIYPVVLYILTGFFPVKFTDYFQLFSINQIEMIILGFLIILNSWIMQEAYKIKNDQDLTI